MGVLRSHKDVCEELAARGGDAATAGEKRWPEELPHTEELALLRESYRLHLASIMVRQEMKAGDENDWSELLNKKDLNAWTKVKIQECYSEVKQEDESCPLPEGIPEGTLAHRAASRLGHSVTEPPLSQIFTNKC